MPDRDYLWDPSAEPDAEIAGLEEVLRPLRFQPAEAPPLPEIVPAPRRAWPRRLAWLAAVAMIAGIAAIGVLRTTDAAWTVAPLRGAVVAGGDRVDRREVLHAGQWVETGADAEARIRVGRIGSADLGPGTRARIVRARGTEHRMAMQEGTLHARINAPPRFFLVETPSALAIDLGCVYTLTIDENGAGMLRVLSGEVELVAGDRRSVVLAGNQARLAPGMGPGLPYSSGATYRFRQALTRYEASADRAGLEGLLAATDSGTTITLWHLLQRVAPADRARVYARLTQLASVPPGVRAEDALALDRGALERWRAHLEDSWTTDPVPAWKRAWRKLWIRVLYG